MLIPNPAAAEKHQNSVADVSHDEAQKQAVKERHDGIGVDFPIIGRGIHIRNFFKVSHRGVVFHEGGRHFVCGGLGKFEIDRLAYGNERFFYPFFRLGGNIGLQEKSAFRNAEFIGKLLLFERKTEKIAIDFQRADFRIQFIQSIGVRL